MDTPPPRHGDAQGLSDQQFDEMRVQVEDPTSSLLDPDDFKSNPQEQRSPSRLGRWFNNVKEVASRHLPARFSPFWGKAASATGRYIGRLAGREALATVTTPGPGNLAVGAYETYRYGKEIDHLIQEERLLAEATRQSAPKEPFYQKAEQDRLHELDKVERQMGGAWKQGVREASKGRWDFRPGDAPSVEHVSDKVQELRTPSLPEAISKAADSHTWRQAERQRLNEVIQGAKTFEGKYMIGTAGEKYQYLLSTATEKLGAEHFDRLHHPDRVLRFEQFAAERLFVDGYKLTEIKSAFSEKSPFITGANESRYLNTMTERFQRGTPHSADPDLSEGWYNLSRWRLEEQIPATNRQTPKEWQAVQKSIARDAEVLSQNRLTEARHLFQEYQRSPEMTLTTRQEYQVELARKHENSPGLRNDDNSTTIKLMLAGHKPEAVEAALNEASPFAHKAGHVQFQEGEYGSRMVRDAEIAMARDSSIKETEQALREIRRDYDIPTKEMRLDRLGLAHEESPSSVQPSPQPQPNRNIESRNIDIDPER